MRSHIRTFLIKGKFENVGPPRGEDCEILHQLERGTKHSLKGEVEER